MVDFLLSCARRETSVAMRSKIIFRVLPCKTRSRKNGIQINSCMECLKVEKSEFDGSLSKLLFYRTFFRQHDESRACYKINSFPTGYWITIFQPGIWHPPVHLICTVSGFSLQNRLPIMLSVAQFSHIRSIACYPWSLCGLRTLKSLAYFFHEWFVIGANLHPNHPCSFPVYYHFLWHTSILINYYFQVSFNLNLIMYVTKLTQKNRVPLIF